MILIHNLISSTFERLVRESVKNLLNPIFKYYFRKLYLFPIFVNYYVYSNRSTLFLPYL